MKIPNVIRLALALATAAALAAACGVSNPFAPAAARTSGQDQILKWAQCMRQHGVDVPDPVNGRISIRATAQPGGNQDSAPGRDTQQFQAAQNACKQYAPNGGNGNERPSAQELDRATKFAQCMRDHGIPMQDPQVQNGGIAFQGGGDDSGPKPDSAQFQQAQQACQHYLPGGGPGGRIGTTSGGGSGSGVSTGGNG